MSYWTYTPSVRSWLSNAQVKLPYKSQLLALNDQHLSILLLVVTMLVLMLKAYWLSIVYATYKWLIQEVREDMRRFRGRRATSGSGLGAGVGGTEPEVVVYEFDMPLLGDPEGSTPPPAEPVCPPKYEDVLCNIPLNANAPPPYILSSSQIGDRDRSPSPHAHAAHPSPPPAASDAPAQPPAYSQSVAGDVSATPTPGRNEEQATATSGV